MHRRPLALAAALLTVGCASSRTPSPSQAAAPPAAANSPVRDPLSLRYTVGTMRYLIEQASHVAQEVMGQVNETDVTSRLVLSVVATEVAGNMSLAVTVDSMTVSGADTTAAVVRGRVFRLVLSPLGVPVSATAPDTTNPVLLQFAQGMRNFLPRLPSGPIASGVTWTDTVTTPPSGEWAVSTRSTREHRVVGWEDREGARALHITTVTTYTTSGAGEQQGMAISLAGGGQSTAESFVSTTGLYVGASERDSSLVNASVTAMGMTVPIRQTRRTTVTRLP